MLRPCNSTEYVTIKEKIMNIDLIFQLAGAGIIIAALSQLLSRAGRDDIALLVTIAGLAGGLFVVVQQVSGLFDGIQRIFGL